MLINAMEDIVYLPYRKEQKKLDPIKHMHSYLSLETPPLNLNSSTSEARKVCTASDSNSVLGSSVIHTMPRKFSPHA
jgi:hypothetical protein